MPTWLFFLIVLGFGLLLAYWADRHKSSAGKGPNRNVDQCEKFRWTFFWYRGRFPNAEELKDEGCVPRQKLGKDDDPHGDR